MELLRLTICLSCIFLSFAQDLTKLENQQHFQGDLKLGLQTRNGVIAQSRKWASTNGLVQIPYEIRSGYSSSDQRLILAAMRRVEQSTCIRFVTRSSQSDYVYIENTSDGCYTTSVGYRRGAIQMSLQSSTGENCMFHPIIVHELLHVVGLWHEHMRSDRDKYVQIHLENVQPALISQFAVVSDAQASNYTVPYDYSSVMHYGKTAFSKDRTSITIEPRNSFYLNVIGRGRDISASDIQKVNRMYNCNSGGTGYDAGGTCADKSSACPSYVSFCGRWDLLNDQCRKTCKFC